MPPKTAPKTKQIQPKKPSTQEVTKELMKNNLTLQSKIIDLVKTNNDVQKTNNEVLKAQSSLIKSQESLTNEIKSMVTLFKEAGEHMVAETEEERLRPLLTRISELVEQNKTIMRGLILIQKYIKSTAAEEIPPAKPLTPEEF